MFVVLHFAENGKPVAVNFTRVKAFDEGTLSGPNVPPHGARVVFAADHAILVKETPMDILPKLPGDYYTCGALSEISQTKA